MTEQETDSNIVKLKSQLIAAGAHFQYDELGASYSYDHAWMQEAFRAARHSVAGKKAFLFLLNHSFDPAGCGDGFEDVIKQAPKYLREYSDPEVRAHILLALGDAYRDRIAVANDAGGDPFQEAAAYKKDIPQNYAAALRYYRRAIAAAPASAPAHQATTRAWALLAGIEPLDTRFLCIYD